MQVTLQTRNETQILYLPAKCSFLSHIVFQPSLLFILLSMHSFVCSLRKRTKTTLFITSSLLTVDNTAKQLNTLG